MTSGSQDTPIRSKMSSSLRERLKRQGRFHAVSPRSPATPLAADVCRSPQSSSTLSATPVRIPPATSNQLSTSTPPVGCSAWNQRPTKLFSLQSPRSNFSSPKTTSSDSTTDELCRWRAEVKAKEEIVRKLRLVKLYRSKNDLEQLASLTARWRSACRQAIRDLMDLLPDPKPRLTELIDQLGLRHRIIGYNAEDECFDDDEQS